MIDDIWRPAERNVTVCAKCGREGLKRNMSSLYIKADTYSPMRILSNLPSILASGKRILLNVVEGIRTASPEILQSAGDAVGMLLSVLIQNLPNILVAGFDMIVSLATGLLEATPEISVVAETVIEALWGAIEGIDWPKLGKDIINGLINGIGIMGNALWSAAKKIAKLTIDAIKTTLGIASPSKVMRDKIGKWIPPGVAIGVKANTKPLTDAMRDLSDLTVDSFHTDMNIAGALSGMASNPVSVGKSVNSYKSNDITERILLVLENIEDTNSAILQNTMAMLKEILEAVLGIHIGDSEVFEAVERYRTKRKVLTGGAE